jgi:hypothetical protein
VSPLVRTLQSTYATENVHFFTFDISAHVAWPVDLIITRDRLFHFDVQRCLQVLQRINRSGAKFLIIILPSLLLYMYTHTQQAYTHTTFTKPFTEPF